MGDYGYKQEEYEKITEKMMETITEVTKFVKDEKTKLTAKDIKDKFGDKTDMANLIIRFSNVCFEAKKFLGKVHSHNFELRGKVAECSTTALNVLTANMRESQTQLISGISDVKEKLDESVKHNETRSKTFAEVAGVGEKPASLVQPIKKAMRQIREADSRSKNVVIYGLNVDASESNDVEAVKKHAATIIRAIQLDSGVPQKYEIPDLKQFTILGKLKPGKAPPVLVSLTNETEAKAVLGNAKKLRTKRRYKNVYISSDKSVEERKEQKALRDKLKCKIEEFPSQHWIIRDGEVTSKGEHVAKESLSDSDSSTDSDSDSYIEYLEGVKRQIKNDRFVFKPV